MAEQMPTTVRNVLMPYATESQPCQRLIPFILRFLSLPVVVLCTLSRLVHHGEEHAVAGEPRKVAHVPLVMRPVHKLMTSEMAVAAKLDDGIWPMLMQVFHHTLNDACHAYTGLVSIDFAQSTLVYLAQRVNKLQKFSVFMSI